MRAGTTARHKDAVDDFGTSEIVQTRSGLRIKASLFPGTSYKCNECGAWHVIGGLEHMGMPIPNLVRHAHDDAPAQSQAQGIRGMTVAQAAEFLGLARQRPDKDEPDPARFRVRAIDL